MLLHQKTAIVTGSTQGIGLTIARRFAEEGALVMLCDVNRDALDAAAASLQVDGHTVTTSVCDVTDEHQVDDTVNEVLSDHGHLDVFVNNAGITRDATIHKMDVEAFRRVVDVNLTGTWIGTRAAMTVMRAQESGGSIVNMSSISGKSGNFGQTNYSASKAGVVGLTKAAAKEGGRYGVRVNALQPGLIDTGMTAAMPPDVLASRLPDIPLGRIGTADEVANAALFFASPMSSYITGAVLEITGGRNL